MAGANPIAEQPHDSSAAIEGMVVLLATLPVALYLNLPTLWLLVPLAVLVLTKRPLGNYALERGQPGSVGFHVMVCAAVFIPYVIGHYLFAHLLTGADFTLTIPDGFGRQALDQFLMIGLSEEMFFRGYLQTQFDRAWGRPYTLLGARVGVGLVLASALFAICHLFRGGPQRLVVFFPGLLYGWLRARTDNIAVPSAYHAVSNLLMSIMVESLR